MVFNMITLLKPLLDTMIGILRSRALLHLEILALRQQLAMIADRDCKRVRFHQRERLFWVLLYRCCPGCLRTLLVFQSELLYAGIAMDSDFTGAENLPVVKMDDRPSIKKFVN